MKYTNNKPIYLQISRDIVKKLYSKEMKKAELLSSVRELGVIYGVTPKTIQSVTAYLDEKGIIKRKPGVGSVITNEYKVISDLHYKHGLEDTLEYINEMKNLHYSNEQIKKFISNKLMEGNEDDNIK